MQDKNKKSFIDELNELDEILADTNEQIDEPLTT